MASTHAEYPKSLYLHGWHDLDATVVVYGDVEEEEQRQLGYKSLSEFSTEGEGSYNGEEDFGTITTDQGAVISLSDLGHLPQLDKEPVADPAHHPARRGRPVTKK